MVNILKRALRRSAVLEGLSQNQTYGEIAEKLQVNKVAIYRDVSSMRFKGDPGLVKALQMRQAKRRIEKELWAKTLEENFSKMTGMSIQEKSFENMVHYYNAELMFVLSGLDSEKEIKKLPLNTRRALSKAGLLNSRHTEITQKALDYLLPQIDGTKTRV